MLQDANFILQGCFLYAKLILDLLESGQLVVKAGSYKVIPRTLAEIYQLILNLRLVFSLVQPPDSFKFTYNLS